MAFMIPQNILPTASELDKTTFDLLRKALPAECTVWHKSALELEPAQQIPFLLLGEQVGIVVIIPLGWQLPPMDKAISSQTNAGPYRLSREEQADLQEAEQQVDALQKLIIGSRLKGLVNSQGSLQPVLHRVYILNYCKSKDVPRSLRTVADGAIVLTAGELPQLYAILRQCTPANRHLTDETFNAVRLIVSPSVAIRLPHRDDSAAAVQAALSFEPIPMTLDLQQEQIVKSFMHSFEDQERLLARDMDARLVRGVVGSGKSLILLHKAKFISQTSPSWKILILTYNRSLADFLRNRLGDLPGPSDHIHVDSFHAWCRRLLVDANMWRSTVLDSQSPDGLVKRLLPASMMGTHFSGIDASYLREEIGWIRDQGYTEWEQYAKAARSGRKHRFVESQRREVWSLLQRYRDSMRENRQLDWPEVPLLVLEGLAQGRIPAQQYHVILVDEAQDFAPAWFVVIQLMLKPATNMLFIVADAAQKVYRQSLSWHTLGIDVMGNRSRILNRSYRNTYEILRVAYEMLSSDQFLRQEIQNQGEDIIRPELDSRQMRHGPMPIILQFADPAQEMHYIAQEIKTCKTHYKWQDIAIIYRDLKSLREIEAYLHAQAIPVQVVKGRDINLASPDVKLITLHSSKGLEFSVVFIAGVDRLQPRPGLTGEELATEIAEERRLLYVGMTRARDRLYISHTGPLPVWVAASLTMFDDR